MPSRFIDFPAVHPARQLAAGLALALVLFHGGGQAHAADVLDNNKVLIAHNGDDLGGAVGGAVILSDHDSVGPPHLSGGVTYQRIKDSLFGNWLLAMAYQRDPELQRIAKRLGFVNTLTMVSVVGVTGLGLAQSIVSYNDVEPGGSHGEEGHAEIESRAPAVMGIVGSGVTIAALGTRAVINAHYKRKIHLRQQDIATQIDGLLADLAEGKNLAATEETLAELVGKQAGHEFLVLWQLTYGLRGAPTAPPHDHQE